MFELFSIIPVAAWIAIITATITSTIAFIGISYTNQQTLNRMKVQHKHEINIRDKEITRERAEELYVNVKSYGLTIFTSNMPFYEAMIGNISFTKAQEFFIESNKNLDYDLSRIHMISAVYFPAIEREINELVDFNGEICKIIDIFKVKHKAGTTKDMESAALLIKKSEDLNDKISKLEKNIAEACKNV